MIWSYIKVYHERFCFISNIESCSGFKSHHPYQVDCNTRARDVSSA